jgi:hypothetical protein
MGKGLPRFFEQMKYTQSTLVGYGLKVPPGSYRLRLKAEPTYSSRTYFSRQEELTFNRSVE